MILFLLGLVDIIAGIIMVYPEIFSSVLFYFGFIVLLKGIFSFASSAMKNYWLDWMGIVDIITGMIILFSFSIPYFYILPISKGFYTILLHYGTKSYI